MAKGYWGPGSFFCRCCKSGPKAKYCCPVCGWVIKAPWDGSPMCPNHRVELVCMGDKWRPLKKKHWKINAQAAQNQQRYLQRLRDARESK